MGFLETLVRVFDGCVGLLEVLTIFLTVAAVYLGMKAYQRQTHVAHHHGKHATRKPAWWPVAVLGLLAIAFIALTAFKYLHEVR